MNIQATKFTVNVKGSPVSFESPYSNEEALAKLPAVPGDFAADLGNKASQYGLSPKQWAWVHKLVVDHEHKANAAPVVKKCLLPLIELFDAAAAHLKRPRITFVFSSGLKVRLSRATPVSKNPGCVYVVTIPDKSAIESDDNAPGNVYQGCVRRDGSFRPSYVMNPSVPAMLEQFAADPAKFAASYGQGSGECAFCGQSLTDPKSVSVGYGPVCAKSWGLPWGSVTELHAVQYGHETTSNNSESLHGQAGLLLPAFGTNNGWKWLPDVEHLSGKSVPVEGKGAPVGVGNVSSSQGADGDGDSAFGRQSDEQQAVEPVAGDASTEHAGHGSQREFHAGSVEQALQAAPATGGGNHSEKTAGGVIKCTGNGVQHQSATGVRFSEGAGMEAPESGMNALLGGPASDLY